MTNVLRQKDGEEGKVPSKKERAVLIRASLREEDLEFDLERARTVLGIIYGRFIDQVPEHRLRLDAPQWRHRPQGIEEGSAEHQIWLWNAATTDLRSESDVVYHTHRLLWENHKNTLQFNGVHRPTRELYQQEVLGWLTGDYMWALSKCRFGNPRRNIEWWGRRADVLWNAWGGNPFKMFSLGTIDAVMEWKGSGATDPIPGVGPKIASLIAIYFEEIGMDPVPDAFPVDVHVQRLALALRIVVPKRPGPIMNETLEKLLRPRLVALCKEEGWSRIILAWALWFRGNRGCTGCWKTPHVKDTCPVFSQCQGAYLSRPYFKMGLWLPDAGPMGKGGHAPLVPFDERPLFTGIPIAPED